MVEKIKRDGKAYTVYGKNKAEISRKLRKLGIEVEPEKKKSSGSEIEIDLTESEEKD
jgi:uncharacterized protein YfaS (alpha-2-macroglobulin family)